MTASESAPRDALERLWEHLVRDWTPTTRAAAAELFRARAGEEAEADRLRLAYCAFFSDLGAVIEAADAEAARRLARGAADDRDSGDAEEP